MADSKQVKLPQEIEAEIAILGSLFITISGFIFLYIAYNDDDMDVEIAFN